MADGRKVRPNRMFPMRGARLRLTGVAAAVALLAPGMASADNGVGGWSSLADWPLITDPCRAARATAA